MKQFYVLLFLTTSLFARSQTNVELEALVAKYFESESGETHYNNLASLMEFNASVSLEEASHYYNLYNTSKYIKLDPRYPLLADFILADVLYYSDKTDSAFQHYMNLSSAAKRMGENMLSATGFGNGAFVLEDLGDYMGAVKLLKGNLDISSNTGDIRDLSDHLYNIASGYENLGIRDSSIHYFEKTIAIDRLAQNQDGMLYNMNVLLGQYLEAGENEKALDLCEECIAVAKEIKNLRAENLCRSKQATAYKALEKYELAELTIVMAIDIESKRGDLTRSSALYRSYANILDEQGSLKKAEENYLRALELANQFSSHADIIQANHSYSRFLAKQGKYEEAEELALTTFDLLEEKEMKRYELLLLRLLADINVKKNDYENALEYRKREIKIIENRLASNNLVATEQSVNSFDLYKMESANRVLSVEKQLAEARVRKRNNLILASGIILFLLGTLAYFFFQAQRQKANLEAKNLELQVVEKELLALRSQMNPHFLFNSLNSINDYIMHEEPRLASRYLTKFSELMRTILNNSKERLISLERELEYLNLYVEMENVRFTDQFEYQVSVQEDIDPEHVKMPSMILQPYIENAIKHGLRNKGKRGILRLKISKQDNRLQVEIFDNGIGRNEAMKYKSKNDGNRVSHAMNITSDRIAAINKIYEINASIQVVDHIQPSGTSILLDLPYLPDRNK